MFDNAKWDFINSRELVWCHRANNLLYLVDVHISIETELFRNGIFPREKREIVYFTPELLAQGANFFNLNSF